MNDGSFLTAAETRTLEALCDTLIPRTPPPRGAEDPGGLLARSASDLDVAGLLVRALAPESEATKARFRKLLRLMGSPLLGLLLAGRPAGFAHLPPALRETTLRRMAESRWPLLRQAFQALKRPVAFIFYSAAADPE